MSDAVQAVTTTQVDQTKFVTKKQARKLDRAKDKYESLITKADKLANGGTTKAFNNARKDCAKVNDKFDAIAKQAGVTSNLQAITDLNPRVILVAEGKKLTREQRNEVEKLEKDVKKSAKELAKYTPEFLHKLTKTAPEQYTAEQKKAANAQTAYDTAKRAYEAKVGEYGIPTQSDILEAVYKYEDPVKASKMKEALKKQLKDANMFFGATEAAFKEDIVKDNIKARSIENVVNNNIEKGYVGVSNKTLKQVQNRDAAEFAEIAKEAAGADNEFDRKSNERKINQFAINTEFFNEADVEANKDKAFAEVKIIKVDGHDVQTKDINRITLLSGEVLTGEDIKNVKLGQVRTVEAYGYQYDFKPIVKQKGDEGYVSNKNIRKANKEIGFEYVKPNILKAVGETAVQMTPVAGAVALSKFVFEVNDIFKFNLEFKDGNGIQGGFLEGMIDDINKQLQNQMGNGDYSIEETDKIVKLGIERYIHQHKEHYCYSPAVTAAAVALISNVIEQLQKGEEVVGEKAYHAARERLSLELKHNSAGGDGHTLGEDELNVAMAQVMNLLKEMKRSPIKYNPVTEVKKDPIPTPKPTATIVETYIKPEIKKAEYCVYDNKPGEYWSGIVKNTYKDENGNLITNWDDIKEIYSHIRTLNGYKASDANMPKGVKVVREFTTKSGKKYTYSCCGEEPKNRAISDSLPTNEAQKKQAQKFGKTVNGLYDGTKATVVKPAEFGYYYDLSDDEQGNIEGPKAQGKDDVEKLDNNEVNINAQEKTLIEKGYDVLVKWFNFDKK